MHRARVPGEHERVGRVARHPGMSNGALELPMHASSGPVENVALLTYVLREKESRVRRWRPQTALLPPDKRATMATSLRPHDTEAAPRHSRGTRQC